MHKSAYLVLVMDKTNAPVNQEHDDERNGQKPKAKSKNETPNESMMMMMGVE